MNSSIIINYYAFILTLLNSQFFFLCLHQLRMNVSLLFFLPPQPIDDIPKLGFLCWLFCFQLSVNLFVSPPLWFGLALFLVLVIVLLLLFHIQPVRTPPVSLLFCLVLFRRV